MAAGPGRGGPRPALRRAVAEPRAGHRPRRPTSPVHAQVAAAGAIFGTKMGWERPNVFAPTPGAELDYSWGKPSWLPWSAAEQRATREAVAVFDQTSFSKYVVAGPRRARGAAVGLRGRRRRAGRALRLHAVAQRPRHLRGRPHRHPGRAGLLLARLDVGHHGSRPRLAAPPRRRRGRDVTDAYAVLGVMGPASRALLKRLSSDDWSEDGFPFATSRTATVAGVPLRATRMTYVGELGWELTVPVGGAATVYDALFGEGAGLGAATPATTRSSRSGWRRATGPSGASCLPTTPRSRPGWCSPPH